MKKFGIAVLAAASLAGASAQSASAAGVPGPCERVQELFETANVEMPPTHPVLGTAYGAACRVTG